MSQKILKKGPLVGKRECLEPIYYAAELIPQFTEINN